MKRRLIIWILRIVLPLALFSAPFMLDPSDDPTEIEAILSQFLSLFLTAFTALAYYWHSDPSVLSGSETQQKRRRILFTARGVLPMIFFFLAFTSCYGGTNKIPSTQASFFPLFSPFVASKSVLVFQTIESYIILSILFLILLVYFLRSDSSYFHLFQKGGKPVMLAMEIVFRLLSILALGFLLLLFIPVCISISICGFGDIF
ncbi:MAG: hypothetical protein LBG65_08160 [Puniceicoccales bacterium]|jgi:hypothetical protein|nr:hypothetical protein [Puniceicoccales bacterium]